MQYTLFVATGVVTSMLICLYLYCRWRSNYQVRKGWDSFCVCHMPGLWFPTSDVMEHRRGFQEWMFWRHWQCWEHKKQGGDKKKQK